MADYVVLNNNSGNYGMIAINKRVFQSIAEYSIDDIENAVRVPATRWNNPVTAKVEDNKLVIDADIHIKYGASVSATCELVQNKIYENILFMTGYKTSNVSVNVIGFEI